MGKMRIKCKCPCPFWGTTLLVTFKLLLYLTCGMHSIDFVKSEFFTAVVDLEVLVETEFRVLHSFSNFVIEEGRNLQRIKK